MSLLKRHRDQPYDQMEDTLLQPRNGQRVGYGSVHHSEDEEEESDLQHVNEAADVTPITTAAAQDGEEIDPAVIRFKTRPKSRHRKSTQSESARNSLGVNNSVSGGDQISRSTSKCSTSGEEEEKPAASPGIGLKSALIWFYTGGRSILVKYWIWMVALMLMIMSVSGKRVVVFRIFYMILFLAFLLTFQVSTQPHHMLLQSFTMQFLRQMSNKCVPFSFSPPSLEPVVISCMAEVTFPLPADSHFILHAGSDRNVHIPVPELPHVLGKVSESQSKTVSQFIMSLKIPVSDEFEIQSQLNDFIAHFCGYCYN